MKRHTILIFSLIATILFFGAMLVSIFGLCNINNSFLCSRPHEGIYVTLLLPFFFLFIFSLITYKAKDETYSTWHNFVKWWIPLSLVVIVISPRYSHDWMFPIDKGGVSLAVSIIFVVISLILISYKSYKLRGK